MENSTSTIPTIDLNDQILYWTRGEDWNYVSTLRFTYSQDDSESNNLRQSSEDERKQNDDDEKPISYFLQIIGTSDSKQKPQSKNIVLNHNYDVHYLNKKACEKKILRHMCEGSVTASRRDTLLKHIQIPTHSIIIERESDSDDRNIFHLIGFNGNDSKNVQDLTILIAKLHYETLYSEQGLVDQVQDRLEKLIKKAFKDIIRNIARRKGLKFNDDIWRLIRQLFVEKKLVIDDCFENKETRMKEAQNVVYKLLISEGIFPIYCELNTMGTPFYYHCLKFCITEAILPWSSKFHSSLIIGDNCYSFTPNNKMNNRKLFQRKYHKDFNYLRIKVMDFFPLDDWIIKLSSFLVERLALFIDEMAYSHESLSHILKRSQKLNISNALDPFKDKIIVGSITVPQNRSSTVNTKTGIKQPLLSPKNNPDQSLGEGSIFKKFGSSNQSKVMRNPSDFCSSQLGEFNSELHSVMCDKLEKGRDHLTRRIAEEFYKNYEFELTKSQILWRFSKIYSKTEIKSYQELRNNCQTPVAEFVFSIHERFQQFIEPLQEFRGFDSKGVAEQENYFKFKSGITMELFNRFDIQPMILKSSLDYFGIYADADLKSNLGDLKIFDMKNIAEGLDFCKKFPKELKEFLLFIKEVPERMEIGEVNPKESGGTNSDPDNNSQSEYISDEEEEVEMFSKNKEVEISGGDKKMISPKISSGNMDGQKPNQQISHFLYLCQNAILELTKKIQNPSPRSTGVSYVSSSLKAQKRCHINLHRELSYFYHNSVRLKNSLKQNKNNISYIGHLIIKDPGRLHTELPENAKEKYSLF